MSREIQKPLPSDWLPKPVARAGKDDLQIWESRICQLLAKAEPTLERYRARDLGWWSALSYYWRPVAASALATAMLLILFFGLGSQPGKPSPGSNLVLMAAASDGSPEVLWAAIGEEADPVLALIALAEEAQ